MLLYIPTYPSIVYIWQYDTMLNLRINDSGLYYVILGLRDTSCGINILYFKTLSTDEKNCILHFGFISTEVIASCLLVRYIRPTFSTSL